jgi:hypothetical protein
LSPEWVVVDDWDKDLQQMMACHGEGKDTSYIIGIIFVVVKEAIFFLPKIARFRRSSRNRVVVFMTIEEAVLQVFN